MDNIAVHLEVAAREYLARQDRRSDPVGGFEPNGTWFPAPSERRDCCDEVRWPSRRWPWSLMEHCRSAKHVAALYNVSRADLLRVARRIEEEEGSDGAQ